MIQPYMNIYYDFRNEPARIRVLQQMLRFISRASGDETLNVAVDGRYDRGTENAVRAFQRKYGLSETGVVDLPTWEKIREIYAAYGSGILDGDGEGIYPFLRPRTEVRAGEKSTLVMILQIILDSLRLFYDGYGEIPLSGVYDKATEDAIRAFQRANLLDATGVTDRVTWNRLAEAYNFAERERQ